VFLDEEPDAISYNDDVVDNKIARKSQLVYRLLRKIAHSLTNYFREIIYSNGNAHD